MGYIFDPEVLRDVTRSVLGLPIGQMVTQLAEGLHERYPGHVQRAPEWVFNNAGGAMGMMAPLHLSVTEYVIVFGTPIGTEGHTGRFAAEDHFFILEGEQWAYDEGQFERSVYRADDVHVLPRRHARGYRMPDRCFALEYARGAIPLMLPFGLADAISSTLDVRSALKTLRLFGASAARELLQGKL